MNIEMNGRVWKRRLSVGTLMISLLILSWGVVWLGNDLGWWQMTFPIIPIVLIILGLSLLVNQLLSVIYY
ncbi:MAG: hypothetical protein ACOX1V_04915 [Candidatus Iainarchaeum sp.]|jgi:hypothetical protein|nr:MAG: hypothetical protein BWY55_00758 [archaeon ADurb.Bin336]